MLLTRTHAARAEAHFTGLKIKCLARAGPAGQTANVVWASGITASTKSHASGKIKNRYFRILRKGSNVFFDADSDAPHMT